MIALVGSGEYLPEMETVDRALMARLPAAPRVVCLPTAAGLEGVERIGYWSRLGVEHFTRLGAEATTLPVIDSATANDEAHARAVAGADLVYLSGGNPRYLYQTLNGSRVWAAITQVRQKGGLLAGCSAGAMIMGARIYTFPGWIDGFGLLPHTAVLPHFDEIPGPLVRLIKGLVRGRLPLVGIDGYTALVAGAESGPEVVGSGRVVVWDQDGRREYRAGGEPIVM